MQQASGLVEVRAENLGWTRLSVGQFIAKRLVRPEVRSSADEDIIFAVNVPLGNQSEVLGTFELTPSVVLALQQIVINTTAQAAIQSAVRSALIDSTVTEALRTTIETALSNAQPITTA